ncbi:MAG: hypothetical protein ACR2NA_09405 [Solirubrobacterales bacterium]
MSDEDILRERRLLSPRWRMAGVGRALRALGGLVEATESLLATCPGTVPGVEAERPGQTALVAATDRRVIVVALNTFGIPGTPRSLSWDAVQRFGTRQEGRRTLLEIAGQGFDVRLRSPAPAQLAALLAVAAERCAHLPLA